MGRSARTAQRRRATLSKKTNVVGLAEVSALASRARVVAADDPPAAPAPEAFDNMAPCAGCDHPFAMHDGDTGACAIEGCSCAKYEEAEAAAHTASVSDRLVLAFLPSDLDGADEAAVRAYVATHGKFSPITGLIPAEHQPVEELPAPNASPAAPDVTMPAAGGALRWTAVLCPEGVATDDGRIFAPGSIEWRDLPLTLMGMIETQEGHDGAQVCGRIDRIWRAGNLILGEGEFDTGDYGLMIGRMVGDQTLRGVSVDIAATEADLVKASNVLNEEGEWRDDEIVDEEEIDPLELLFGGSDESLLFVVRKGVIGAATVCPFPAFAGAQIEVAASLTASAQSPFVWTHSHQAGWRVTEPAGRPALVASSVAERAMTRLAAAGISNAELVATVAVPDHLTAAAAGLAPVQPPAEWFANPDLDGPTALVVTAEGRVYGHAAQWDTCHLSFNECVQPPHSHAGYAYYHLKEVECEDGSRVACGTVTLDTGHAAPTLSRAAATAHYDNTGTAVADVVVGEDTHGIWVAGALRPDADAETARKLSGAVLSGDWRNVSGNLELVGLLAVNIPGFPVPRAPRALAETVGATQETLALVAAGIVTETAAPLDAGLAEVIEIASRAR